MIIKSVRDYMRTCPHLNGSKKVNVDYLPNLAVEYSIDPVSIESTIKTYSDGGKLKQYAFVFASKESYSGDVITNIENSGFYEKVEEWVKYTSAIHQLPKLTGRKRPVRMEVLSSGYMFQADEDKARYQMQLRLVYYED